MTDWPTNEAPSESDATVSARLVEYGEFREVVVDAFMDMGLPLAISESCAELTIAFGKTIAKFELAELIGALRPTVFGTALARTYVGQAEESQHAAARRLCVSRKALANAEKRVRECLEKRTSEGSRRLLLDSKSKTNEPNYDNSELGSTDNAA